MIHRRSRRNAEPLGVRCTSTLRRSNGSTLRRARSNSPKPIQRSCDSGFRHTQIGSQATNRMGTFSQITRQKYPELACGKIRTVSANQRDDSIAQEPHLGIRNRVGRSCHVNYPFLGGC